VSAWPRKILNLIVVVEILEMVVAAAGELEIEMNLAPPCVILPAEMAVKAVLKEAQRLGGLVVVLGVTRKRRNWILGVLVVEMMTVTGEEMTMMKMDLIVTVVIVILGEMNQSRVTVVCVTSGEMNQ